MLKNTTVDGEEKTNLRRAIEEIKTVTLECDRIMDEMQKKVSLMELQAMLVLRPGIGSVLHLDHLGRELIMQGDLQRVGSKGVRWVDTHALLFDHYFILAKAVTSKDIRTEKKYDVSKEVRPPAAFCASAVTHTLTITSPSRCLCFSSRAWATIPSTSKRVSQPPLHGRRPRRAQIQNSTR